MSNVKTVIETFNKMKKARKEFFINGVLFFVSDPLPDGVDPINVKKRVEKRIPKKLFSNLDYIFVGDFPELKLRDVQSVYMRGAIYINHENQTEDGLYKAIIHELAHSIETTFGSKIYEDNEVAAEFVGKRKQLRPGSVEIYLSFFDSDTNESSVIPKYKIIVAKYGDNEIFKLIKGSLVSNNTTP